MVRQTQTRCAEQVEMASCDQLENEVNDNSFTTFGISLQVVPRSRGRQEALRRGSRILKHQA